MNKRNLLLSILGIEAFTVENGREVLTAAQRAQLSNIGLDSDGIAKFEAALNPAASEPAPATTAALAAEVETLRAQASDRQTEIDNLRAQVEALAAMPDAAVAAAAVAAPAAAFDVRHTSQLGGLPGEMYSLTRAYNLRAQASLLAGQGIYMAAPAQQSVDYASLNEDLGAFYRTPWRDRVQSFLTKLPSVFGLFPLEAGHQDLDTLVSLFLGEFSQADSSNASDFDRVSKGAFELQAETLRMYGVMFVHKFYSLKDLEKSWIGYLNREGSNPVKLSFIEFLLVEVAKALHNEQQLRFVNGVRKNPVANEPGRAMDAADGLYEYIRKRVEGHTDFTVDGGLTGKTVYQIKPFSLGEITPGNIGDIIYQGTSQVPASVRDSGNLVLYMPSFMEAWYNKFNEAKYGQNQDYKPDSAHVKEYPSVAIKYVPNADNHHRLIWTLDGNIKTYCQADGEMVNFTIAIQDWTVKVYSNWKESIQAEVVGKKVTDPALLDGTTQMIWVNEYDRPATFFVEGEADKNPDVLLHSSVVTAKNTADFVISDIANAKVGQAVSIKCGSEGVSIKKTGAFSLISADWTPKRGDVIRLMKRADGKFIELARTSADSEALQFPADAAAPSLLGSTVFVAGANTAATEITALTDATADVVYTIHGYGPKTTASTLRNAGNFALTADITLEAGKFIKLVKANGDGKFYEVARG